MGSVKFEVLGERLSPLHGGVIGVNHILARDIGEAPWDIRIFYNVLSLNLISVISKKPPGCI